MARVNIAGFEAGHVDSLFEVASSSGTVSASSSVTAGAWSAYSLRANPTTTNTGYVNIGMPHATTGGPSTANVATSYVQFRFLYSLAVASGAEPFFTVFRSAHKLELRLTSAGKIAAYNWLSSLMATGTTALEVDTWYTIRVKCGTGTSAAWEVYIDGALEISGTGNLSTNNAQHIQCGKTSNRSSQSVSFYYDDVIWDDAAFPDSNARVSCVRANAAGTYQTWSRGGTDSGNNWDQVDEVPPSTADYCVSTLVIGDAETENLQPASTWDISGVVLVKPMIYQKNGSGSNGGSCGLRTRTASTNYDTSGWVGSTTWQTLSKIYQTNPNSGAAWTTAELDALEVGIVELATTEVKWLSWVGAMIEWVPSTVTGSPWYYYAQCG